MTDTLTNAANSVKDNVQDQASTLTDNDPTGVSRSAKDKVSEATDAVQDQAKDKAGQAADTVTGGGGNPADAITSKLQELQGSHKLNDQGQVVDKTGTVLATLKDGKLKRVAGKKVDIDESGNISRKGKSLGSIEPVVNDDGGSESEEDDDDDSDSDDEDTEESEESPSNDVVGGTASGVKGAKDSAENAGEDISQATGTGEQTGEELNVVEPIPADENEAEQQIEDGTDQVQDAAGDANDQVQDAAGDAQDQAEQAGEDAQDQAEQAGEDAQGQAEQAEQAGEDAQGQVEDAAEDAQEQVGDAADQADQDQQDQQEGDDEDDDSEDESLEGCTVREDGKVVNDEDEVVGQVTEGKLTRLAGRQVNADNLIINKKGKELGRVEPLDNDEEEEEGNEAQDAIEGAAEGAEEGAEEENPLSKIAGGVVKEDGRIYKDDKVVGGVSEGKIKRLIGREVLEDGTIQGKDGKILGKADLLENLEESEDEEEQPEEPQGVAQIAGAVVKDDGRVYLNDEVVGGIVEGKVKRLVGRKVEEDGTIQGKDGKILGKADLLENLEESEDEEEQPEEPQGVAKLAGGVVKEDGRVYNSNDSVIGGVTEGKVTQLIGRTVNDQGIIEGKDGKILGRADLLENLEESEEEEEKETELADLQGCSINENGNVVDSENNIIGGVTEGKVKKMVGRKVSDANGNVYNKRGDLLGRVTTLDDMEYSDSEDEGPSQEEQDAEELSQSLQRLNSMIQSSIDKANPITEMIQEKAQKEELPVEELRPLVQRADRVVGEVRGAIQAVDPNESMINDAKYQVNGGGQATKEQYNLTKTLEQLDEQDGIINDAREKIDNYEPPQDDGPTEEELEEQRKVDERRERANQMSQIIDASIDKCKPLLKQVKQYMDNAERDQKNGDLDEDELVKNVKPLLEQATNIMNETHGAIRALDPNGEIQQRAKGKRGEGESTTEEYYLADRLTYMSDHVQSFIDETRGKLESMPKAKKDLGPLLNMLQQPLVQIIAAVGLLLSGVLGLVQNLLSGLGLGFLNGIVDSVLSGIGLDKIMSGLGLDKYFNF